MEVIGILIMLGVFVIFGIRIANQIDTNKKTTAISKAKKAAKELDFVSFQNGILYLKKRSLELGKIITIEDHYTGNINYNAEQLHYGSVTVGGVTTGGFYKTGGDYSTSNVKKSGYKRLCYAGEGIVAIDLTDELIVQAKDSPMKKYLNSKNQIQVIEPVNYSASEVNLAWNNLTSTGNKTIKIGSGGYPTYEKCSEIIRWICSGNYSIADSDISQTGWTCPNCGRKNQVFMENCFDCGKKRPIVEKNEEKDKDNNNDKPEIDFFADKWKCPDCGKANPNSITFCSCGKTKP